MDLIECLNDRQREAVLATEGPLLVIAGAGSGKTKVLTHRIAYLINEKNVKPWNILAITFTNKAAKEMKERLEGLIGERANDVWVSTFHSTCVKILRREVSKIGYTTSFTIYDDSDKGRIVKECMRRQNVSEETMKPRTVMNYISDLKNKNIEPSMAMKDAEGDYLEQKKALLYKDYEETLFKNNSLDFDDLLLKTLRLFQENEDTLEYYREKFKYIHVDEYQDTNKVQYMLVKLLASKYKNIFVVGDDDQSIYGWRGADISNILNFEKDYDNARMIKLEQNYRSTQNILSLANDVIRNNTDRKDKALWSDKGDGDKSTLYEAYDDREEAKYVADTIKKIVDEGNAEYKDFAVLYRTNAQSRSIEEAVTKYMMPYQVFGSVRFYDRKEIKDIIAYLNVIVNDKDSTSLKRIINVPKRKIGDTSIARIEECATNSNVSFYDVVKNSKCFPEVSKISNTLENFSSLIEKYKEMSAQGNLTRMVTDLLEELDFNMMIRQEAKNDEEAEDRIANINELVSKITYFEANTEEPTLEKFLADVMLMTDSDNLEETDNRIKLMTIHVAKGLEFNNVFLIGLEDGLFPSFLSIDDDIALEEERRLLYVAITRARKKLYMTYATQRMKFGKVEGSIPSRFIDEFPKDLYEKNEKKKIKRELDDIIEMGNLQNSSISYFEGYSKKPMFASLSSNLVSKNKSKISQSASASKVNIDLNVGDKVEHKKFGMGQVKEIKQMEKGDPMIVISLDNGEEKKLIYNHIIASLLKKI